MGITLELNETKPSTGFDGLEKSMVKIIDGFTIAAMYPEEQKRYETTINRLCEANDIASQPYLSYFRSRITVEEGPSFDAIKIIYN